MGRPEAPAAPEELPVPSRSTSNPPQSRPKKTGEAQRCLGLRLANRSQGLRPSTTQVRSKLPLLRSVLPLLTLFVQAAKYAAFVHMLSCSAVEPRKVSGPFVWDFCQERSFFRKLVSDGTQVQICDVVCRQKDAMPHAHARTQYRCKM